MRTQGIMRKAENAAQKLMSGFGAFLSGTATFDHKTMSRPNRNEGCFPLLELKRFSKNQDDSIFDSLSSDELQIYYGYQGKVRYFRYFRHIKWLKRSYFIAPYFGRTIQNYDGLFPISHDWARKICTLAEGEHIEVNGLKENNGSYIQHEPLRLGKENMLVKTHGAKGFISKHPRLFHKPANSKDIFISWGRPLAISSQTEENLLKAMAVILKDAYEGRPEFVVGKNKMNASAIARHVVENLPKEYSRKGIEIDTIRKLIPSALAILEENKIVKKNNC